jgi:hypothetical protein
MRFDVHLRTGVREKLKHLAEEMGAWESTPRINEHEAARVRAAIGTFDHCTRRESLMVGGVDGSGDYPSISYADSFVHVTVAHGTLYRSDALTGLHEVIPRFGPIVEFTWMTEDEERRRRAWDAAFATLSGESIHDAVSSSDYRVLKQRETRRPQTVDQLVANLIRPHAADVGNIGIQLRSTGELGAALRLIKAHPEVAYVLMDGTLTLPLVSRADLSLFYEHLKRLCCVVARDQGVGFFALSKSHGLPSVESVENLAREACGVTSGRPAEHWYLRLPSQQMDGWELSLADGRRLPPVGAVTYLVRFHRTTTVLRLDMDVEYWKAQVRGESQEETRVNERRIFEDLDYVSHDQRSYGYPYPVQAGHDRAALTGPERVALRRQIIDAAVGAGLQRRLFRSASMATRTE